MVCPRQGGFRGTKLWRCPQTDLGRVPQGTVSLWGHLGLILQQPDLCACASLWGGRGGRPGATIPPARAGAGAHVPWLGLARPQDRSAASADSELRPEPSLSALMRGQTKYSSPWESAEGTGSPGALLEAESLTRTAGWQCVCMACTSNAHV